jgi:PAS domain S-box-containing protein
VKRQQKSKQHLDELIALRKQVADLKGEATARKRVEDALRRSEAWHRSLVERCPVALGEIDATGYLLFANDAFARKLGYSSKAEMLALGTGMTVFRGLEERDRALNILRQSAEDLRLRRFSERGVAEHAAWTSPVVQPEAAGRTRGSSSCSAAKAL